MTILSKRTFDDPIHKGYYITQLTVSYSFLNIDSYHFSVKHSTNNEIPENQYKENTLHDSIVWIL